MSGITNPAEKYFKDGLWTFDGSVWRPQNQLLAYRDVVRQFGTIADASAGTNTINLSAVPAGEVWIASSIMAYNANTAGSLVVVFVVAAGGSYMLQTAAYDAVTRIARFSGSLTLKAAEYISAIFYSCALHDILSLYLIGHSFKIAE